MAGLAFEFFVLFFVLPSLFALRRHRVPAIPALWVLMGYCLWALFRDPGFDRAQLWDPDRVPPHLPAILGFFSFAAVVVGGCVWRFSPGSFFILPRQRPRLWALVMVLYPVFSVYPQGVIYRLFLFHRYQPLFRSEWLVAAASVAAFAYVHVIFRNWIAVFMTGLGGAIFALRYWDTGSLLSSSFEHALYGCLMFTIGLGRSFYRGAVFDRPPAA